MSTSIPPPGSSVRATVAGIGDVYGEIVDAKINRDRIAIALWGSGKTIVAGSDEIEALEVVSLSSEQIVKIAGKQRSNPDLARRREKAAMQ